MERVQFQQEQMLPELKDLVERGLFTPNEIKAVIKKRTALEAKLVRRAPRKADYLAYIAYEAELEALRRKRLARLKGKMKEENPDGKTKKMPRTISDYALVRRQFAVFERAVKRFKDDKGLWSAYIELARKEKAWVLVGRVCARAIQMHPNTPSFYILAAQTELERHAPSAARGLLQRGIRMNSEDESLWVEYVRLEMNFVEGLRRRWSVLGISVGSGKGEERETVDVDREEEESADRARGEILQGAIVKSVLESAAKARPTLTLFKSFEELIRTYPTSVELKTSLIDYLHNLITQQLPDDAQAIVFRATRPLRPIPESTGPAPTTAPSTFKELGLEGEALVDAIQRANEGLLAALQQHQRPSTSESNVDANVQVQVEIQEAYTAFVEEWTARLEEQADLADLATYLVLSLRALVKRHQKTKAPCAPALLAADLRLALRTASISSSTEEAEKAVRRARVYCSDKPGSRSGEVWVARMELERAAGTSEEEVQAAWAEARRVVEGTPEEIERVWMWGVDDGDETVLEELINESARQGKWRGVHEVLMLRWVEEVVYHGKDSEEAMDVDPEDDAGKDKGDLRSEAAKRQRLLAAMPGLWRPSARIWAEVLRREDDESVAKVAYEKWSASGDEAGATLGWAGWLLRHGQGARAAGVVDGVRGGARDAVVAGWAEVLRTGQVYVSSSA